MIANQRVSFGMVVFFFATVTVFCLFVSQATAQSGPCFDMADGTACEDGYFCTVGDYCSDWECVAGERRDCSAFTNQCNVGACNEHGDTCEALHVQDGTPCATHQSHSPCTTGHACEAGMCVHAEHDDDDDDFPPFTHDDDDDDHSSWVAWLLGGVLLFIVLCALIYACWRSPQVVDNIAYHDDEIQQSVRSEYGQEDDWVDNLGKSGKYK